MDSLVRISQPLLKRILPFFAVAIDDLKQSAKHWASITWCLLGVVLTIHLLSGMSLTPLAKDASLVAQKRAGQDPQTHHVSYRPGNGNNRLVTFDPDQIGQSASAKKDTPVTVESGSSTKLAGRIYAWQLLLGAFFAVALGSTAIAADAEMAPSAVLCRGIGRWQYLAAKAFSRVMIISAWAVLLTIPTTAFLFMRAPSEFTVAGIYHATANLVVVLGGATLVSVCLGTFVGNSLVAVAIGLMTICGLGFIASLLELKAYSPTLLSASFVDLLRGVSLSGLGGDGLPTAMIWLAAGIFVLTLPAYSAKDL